MRLALAAWRVARILQQERGPYAIADYLRARFPTQYGVVLTASGEREWLPMVDTFDDITWRENPVRWEREIGLLLECPYCSTPWIAAGLLVLDQHPVGRVIVSALAAAGIVALGLDAGGPPPDAGESEHGTRTDEDLAADR